MSQADEVQSRAPGQTVEEVEPLTVAALRDPTKPVMSEEALVRALFRTFLGRDPDAIGLRDGMQMLQDGHGLEDVLAWVLGSREFAARHRDFIRTYIPLEFLDSAGRDDVSGHLAAPRPSGVAVRIAASATEPQIADFTSEQAQLLATLTPHLGQVLLVEYRPEPGSRPTIHVHERAHLPQPRGPQSVEYIDALISDYLLHPDYFHLHADRFPTDGRNLFCIVQIADCPDDIAAGVGFCARDPRITLIPDPHFWSQRGYFTEREQFRRMSVPWQDRLRQAFWRGSSTGTNAQTVEAFQALPRFRLCDLSAKIPGLRDLVDAKLTDIVQARNPEEGDKIHAMAESLGILTTRVPQSEFLKYRYQIDIDGNSNSWSFLLKLLMGSCVLKVSSDWRQWYYDALRPWEHYVPVQADLADLEERIRWCWDNDDAAREIGSNGLKFASGIVFGTEMPQAAARLLGASRTSLDAFFLAPNSCSVGVSYSVDHQRSPRTIRSSAAMPIFDLSENSVEALFAEFRGGRDAFGPFIVPGVGIPPEIGAFDGSTPETRAEMASLLYSVRSAGNRYRMLSLGAAPGEWAVRAERAFTKINPTGNYKSFNLEGDIGHFELITKFLAANHADPNRNVVLYKVIAEIDGWAYFPVINSAVDWGAGIAAISNSPDDLETNIRLSDAGRSDRIAANDGKPLEFRKVPAISLQTLLDEIGPVDFVHSDIQGSEIDVFPAAIETLSEWVRICCISTHATAIESKLLASFAEHGWALECALPSRSDEGICLRDGVFVWANPQTNIPPPKAHVEQVSSPGAIAPVSPAASGAPIRSPDGSTLLPGTGGFLSNAHGVWTFDTAMTAAGNVILLNGRETGDGAAVSLLVTHGGSLFAHSGNGSWYEWIGSWRHLPGDPTEQ